MKENTQPSFTKFSAATVSYHFTITFSFLIQLPPIAAVLGGFSQASKVDDHGAFTNWGADEQGNFSKDIEQFGQLLATLLGHCHGSSEYTQVRNFLGILNGSGRYRVPPAFHPSSFCNPPPHPYLPEGLNPALDS